MMSDRFTVSIKTANWQRDKRALRAVRSEVFIHEQSVPEELEWDGLDDSALHLLAISTDNITVGTARLLPEGHIGRVAVLKSWRHQGIGTALMLEITHQAERLGYKQLRLAAQLQAIPFYERLGFAAYGDDFMDAGIPHKNMRRSMSPNPRKSHGKSHG